MGIRLLLFLMLISCNSSSHEELSLLHVSYDPTREFYAEYNQRFVQEWEQKTGQKISIRQSHGGSGKQARAVIDGLRADMVSLALAFDIDAIAKYTPLLSKEWQTRLPNHSVPFTSTIVFLVRKGNPKTIHDWDDLVREGIQVITPNPKTSGGARWNYLAAYGYALRKANGDRQAAEEFMRQLYRNVPLLDTGARGAATTFTQRGIGDVLISWENEVHLILQEFGNTDFEIVIPSLSIKTEPPVAWIDGVVDTRNTRQVAQEYLRGLYQRSAQELAKKHFFRPIDPAVTQENRNYPPIEMVTIEEFGGWEAAQKAHFEDGALFDQIYDPSSNHSL